MLWPHQVSSFSSVDTAILRVFVFPLLLYTLYHETRHTYAAKYDKTTDLLRSHHGLNDVWFFSSSMVNAFLNQYQRYLSLLLYKKDNTH